MLLKVGIAAAALVPAALAGPWGYPYDAVQWGGVCETGVRQSPVDLPHREGPLLQKAALRASWPASTFYAYGSKLIGGHGLGFEVNAKEGRTPKTFVQDKSYDLIQFHIHTGSEHFIDGKQYAAEVHYVHSRSGDRVDENEEHEVINEEGDLMVIGILFDIWDEVGETPESVRIFQDLLDLLKSDDPEEVWGRKLEDRKIAKFDGDQLFNLLNRREYYSYPGSLTTPPCSEIVSWKVMAEPLYMTATQVASIEKLTMISGTFRPPQPLNFRKIMPDSGDCGSRGFAIKMKKGQHEIKTWTKVMTSCHCGELCSSLYDEPAWRYMEKRGICRCREFTGKVRGKTTSRDIVSSHAPPS